MLRYLVPVLCATVLAACGSGGDSADDAPAGVRIAAFDFAESGLLAELYAQALEARGLPVERLGTVGPREIVAPALQLDQIDVVPEYLGTAASHYGAEAQDLEALTAALAPLGLTALEPAEAQDVNVFVVTESTAQEHGLRRLSDLTGFAEQARFGGPVECPERPLCLLGLEDVYGVRFAEFVPQRSLLRTAEALVRDEIEVGLLFSTSAALAEGSFVVLEDDRALQPDENVLPVVRRAALERWGSELSDALDGVSGALTTSELRTLNRRVEDGEPIEAVAASWLAGAGLDGS